jgi:hypothetical protein
VQVNIYKTWPQSPCHTVYSSAEGRGGVEIILKCVVLIDADAPPISYVWLNNPGVCYLRTELMRNCLVIDIAAVNDLRFKEKGRYIKCKHTV